MGRLAHLTLVPWLTPTRICLAAVPHILDPDLARIVIERVEHAVIGNPDAPAARHADNECSPRWPGFVRQFVDCSGDALSYGCVQCVEMVTGGGPELHLVTHSRGPTARPQP